VLELLSDAVFAIAITLLFPAIHIPMPRYSDKRLLILLTE